MAGRAASYAPETGLNDEQARRLWLERVDLVDSLVKVRYAEGLPPSFLMRRVR